MDCVEPTLSAMASTQCMVRASYPRSGGGGLALPVYVAHARRLHQRRAHLNEQLSSVGAPDVTLVLCADADEVASLDADAYRCVHPSYTRTSWSDARHARLPNATLSLALKHRLAHRDMHKRRLRAALVIEDDAVFGTDLPSQLSAYLRVLPADAALLFLGSYSRNPNPRLTLAELPTVVESPRLHRRLNGSASPGAPQILGTVAYVVTRRGAAMLANQPVRTSKPPADRLTISPDGLEPRALLASRARLTRSHLSMWIDVCSRAQVRAEADVDLSLLAPTSHCGATTVLCEVAAPIQQYDLRDLTHQSLGTLPRGVRGGRTDPTVRSARPGAGPRPNPHPDLHPGTVPPAGSYGRTDGSARIRRTARRGMACETAGAPCAAPPRAPTSHASGHAAGLALRCPHGSLLINGRADTDCVLLRYSSTAVVCLMTTVSYRYGCERELVTRHVTRAGSQVPLGTSEDSCTCACICITWHLCNQELGTTAAYVLRVQLPLAPGCRSERRTSAPN